MRTGSNGTNKRRSTMTTTKAGTRIASKHAETMLERSALRWLNEQGEGYDNGAAGAYADLMHGGCQAGTVGHLIYYRDTVAFYRRHRKDIAALLKEAMEESGLKGPGALFGDKWDDTDPLSLDDPNCNLLAWFGFEEAARLVARRAGIED